MPTIDDLLSEAYCNWDNPEVLSRTGRELQNRNRLDHARRILHRAVELDPSYPQARLERARVLLAVKRAADALADLDLFLSTNPDYAPALHDRGRARVMLGLYEAALSDLDRAVVLGAGPAARVDRGSVHAQLRRFNLAREDAEAAIRLDAAVLDPTGPIATRRRSSSVMAELPDTESARAPSAGVSTSFPTATETNSPPLEARPSSIR